MSRLEEKVIDYMKKHPKVAITQALVGGFIMLGGAWWTRQSLLAWEATGGEKAMPRFVYWLYSIGGINAPAILFGLSSLIFFRRAYQIFKEMTAGK